MYILSVQTHVNVTLTETAFRKQFGRLPCHQLSHVINTKAKWTVLFFASVLHGTEGELGRGTVLQVQSGRPA